MTIKNIVSDSSVATEVPTKYAKEARNISGKEFSRHVKYKDTVGDYMLFGNKIPIKVLRGNNGNFSRRLNQGIYRMTIPTIFSGFVGSLENNQ